jgi:hypothetical protein
VVIIPLSPASSCWTTAFPQSVEGRKVTEDRKPTATPVPFFGFAPRSWWNCASGIHRQGIGYER